MTRSRLLASLAAALCALAPNAAAQWNPSSGQWGKQESDDLRVMTWNVRDGICRTNAKVEGANNWCAIARTIAAFRPDVLLLQECGDNSANGTGSGVDSVTNLTTTVSLLMNGGNDPFLGGSVTSYVAKYAPGFSMPHVFVSSNTDGFNRNVLVSRYPFADLNGDTRSVISDIPNVGNTTYAPGGDGGIRGFQFAEIDLPDGVYAGDVVVGNAHLKAGGSNSDEAQRREAAQNVAYYVDHLFNGAGTGIPDPFSQIGDSPQAQTVLDEFTPVILGGDWNEDEITNGQRGPAAWLTEAAAAGGTDGTDRDRSDMSWDPTVNAFTGSDNTLGSKKLDYVAAQDSLLQRTVSTIFDSNVTPFGALPAELLGFPTPIAVSGFASDHDAVVVDYRFVLVCPTPSNYCTGVVNSTGNGVSIGYGGSTSIAANDLLLQATGAPANSFGIFFYGAAQANSSFGDGLLCVGGGGVGISRLSPAQLTNAFGDAFRAIDYTAPPANAGNGLLSAGDTRYFQFWYRDGAAGLTGVNLSDGLEVTFCP